MNDAYDPQEDEGRRSSQYVSRKDFRVVAVVLIVLAVISWPVYMYMLGQVNKSVCSKNLRKIGQALQTYVGVYDDRLPFAYETSGFNSNDMALRKGYAYTWQWALQPYAAASPQDWSVFRCPAADEKANTKMSDGNVVRESSYGMLSAYGGVLFSTILNPDRKAIISETVSNGVEDTADPLRIVVGGVTLRDDGFMIGFDNSQDVPNKATKFATRLAFPGSGSYGFHDDTDGRHPGGIHFLFPDGHVRSYSAPVAKVSQLGGSYGLWDVPLPLHPTSPKPLAP